MPIQPSKLLLIASVVGILSLVPVQMPGQTTAPSSQAKDWKNRAEYDLFDAITNDGNPRTKLEKLQQWGLKYPESVPPADLTSRLQPAGPVAPAERPQNAASQVRVSRGKDEIDGSS